MKALLIIICAYIFIHGKQYIIIVLGVKLVSAVMHCFIHITVHVYLIMRIVPVIGQICYYLLIILKIKEPYIIAFEQLPEFPFLYADGGCGVTAQDHIVPEQDAVGRYIKIKGYFGV